jgi:hypothetical protein
MHRACSMHALHVCMQSVYTVMSPRLPVNSRRQLRKANTLQTTAPCTGFDVLTHQHAAECSAPACAHGLIQLLSPVCAACVFRQPLMLPQPQPQP